MRRVSYNVWSIARDMAVNQFLIALNSPQCVLLYNIATANPIQIAITMIASKFGISKMAVVLILAFIL